jgi:hypothetical protein
MNNPLNAIEGSGVSVINPTGSNDTANISGKYKVSCFGPVDEFKPQYDVLFSQKLKFDEVGDSENSLKIQEELDKIPMKELWDTEYKNVVCNGGKALMLNNFVAASATQAGIYMGLISSVSYSATSATDTMLSHTGWLEAGTSNAPNFNTRLVPTFATATSNVLSTALTCNFTITGAGTLIGAFIVMSSTALGTATSSIGSTAGVLLSAGGFQAGNQVVAVGNLVAVSYSLTL